MKSNEFLELTSSSFAVNITLIGFPWRYTREFSLKQTKRVRRTGRKQLWRAVGRLDVLLGNTRAPLVGASVVLLFPMVRLEGWSRLVLHKHKTHCGEHKSCFVHGCSPLLGGVLIGGFCLVFVYFYFNDPSVLGVSHCLPGRVNM